MLPVPDPMPASMPDYVVVFADSEPPKQSSMTAISDEHAVDLLKKEYATVGWTLYREGKKEPIFQFAPEKSVS